MYNTYSKCLPFISISYLQENFELNKRNQSWIKLFFYISVLLRANYNFTARNKHYGSIAHNLAISTTPLLHCMKNSIKPWTPIELNVWQSRTFTLRQNAEEALEDCSEIFYISCWTDTRNVGVPYVNAG